MNLLLLLLSLAIVLAVAAPFGTTILGFLAISQIRRSAGRIRGLGLALFDALLFPLLLLDAFIGLIWFTVAKLTVAALPLDWKLHNPVGLDHVCVSVAIVLTVLSAVAVDGWIIRWAWQATKTPISGASPSRVIPPVSRRRRILAFCAAMIALLGVLVGALLLRSHSVSNYQVFAMQAHVRYRVFEAGPEVVDKLIRTPADLPLPEAPSFSSNTNSQTAEISNSTLVALLAAEDAQPGLLMDSHREISLWPRVADTWRYTSGSSGDARAGTGSGFLGVRRDGDRLQLRVEYILTHQVGTRRLVQSKIFYEGAAPSTDHALAFYLPFARGDGKSRYLVIAFEILRPEPSFGPVMERIIPLQKDVVSFIDFQTGNILSKRWETEAATDEAVAAWLKQTGADACAEQLPGGFRLAGIRDSCVFVQESSDDFDSARASDYKLKIVRERNVFWGFADASGTFWFRSRDGASGLLQVFGILDNSHAVRIRYKLLTSSTASRVP